jgi:hypothetical protein
MFSATAMGCRPDLPLLPGAGKDLVGSPAEQERVGAPVDLAYEHRGLVVEVRHGPAAALESAAGSSSRPPIPCAAPSTETNVVVSFMIAVPFSLVDFVGHGTVRAANRSACRFGPLSS